MPVTVQIEPLTHPDWGQRYHARITSGHRAGVLMSMSNETDQPAFWPSADEAQTWLTETGFIVEPTSTSTPPNRSETNMNTSFGTELHNTPGRLFVRAVHQAARADYGVDNSDLAGAVMVFGVVEIPKSIEIERLHAMRLNSHLWIDPVHSRLAKSQHGYSLPELREFDASSVLEQVGFAIGALPDAGEVLVRATHLAHENSGMRWAYVIGLMAHRPRSMPVDGLYAVDAQRARPELVSPERYPGSKPGSILRKPMWGPGGKYGFGTSMEPKTYDAWIEGNRAENAKRDPEFGLFLEEMEAIGAPEMPAVYTEGMRADHDEFIKRVMAKMAADAASEVLAKTGVSYPPAAALSMRKLIKP